MLRKNQVIIGLSVVLTLALSLNASVISTEQIKADWLKQNELRSPGLYGGKTKVTVASDAAGGCDGVIDGMWGFHTENEDQPWWQVDLGKSVEIDRIILYNRTELAERACRIIIKVSIADEDISFKR